jgi:hypothetical protein
MGYIFTADQMIDFFKIYSTPETGNVYSFARAMKEKYNIDEQIASIIWQSMDVAEGNYLSIIRANTPKPKTVLNQSFLYQCKVCGKNTTGKKIMSNDGKFHIYMPRKHKANGDVCPGSYEQAKRIVNEKYIDKGENDEH